MPLTDERPVSSTGGKEPGLIRFGNFLPWILLVVGLLVTYQLWKHKQLTASRDLRANFDFSVQEIVVLIEQRMKAYEQVLRGAKGLFAASRSIERDEFHDYVTALKLEENYPGIQGVGFSLIVPPGTKDSHIASIRAEGFPNYSIRPDGERETYTSIIYLEPFTERNLRAFGYDMYSEEVRRVAMAYARDTGKAALSGKVRLVQETAELPQAGTLMYLPIYANNKVHNTLESCRASIVGWVYAAFRMDDLMHGLFSQRTGEVDMEIYDGRNISEKTLLYDSDKTRFSDRIDATLQSTKQIEIAGQTWTVAFRSLPPFERRMKSDNAGFVASMGIVLSLLLTLSAWLTALGRSRAIRAEQELAAKQKQLEDLNRTLEQRVTERTAELERLNRELESFCYSISHELRAPIARLDGFSAAIAEHTVDGGSPELSHLAERLGAASRKLRSVIDSLLIMYRLSRSEVVREPVDLSEICRQITGELLKDVGDRTVKVIVAPDIVVQGDRRMLGICLQHLLGNALKYSSKTPDAVVEFGVARSNGKKVYYIRDNGAGFDMAFADKLFEPFCRLHKEEEFEGSGIGLPTVQRIIERHGGRIWGESEPGKGATFYFTLRDD